MTEAQKPPSLKKLALAELKTILDEVHETSDSIFTATFLYRALEALPDDT